MIRSDSVDPFNGVRILGLKGRVFLISRRGAGEGWQRGAIGRVGAPELGSGFERIRVSLARF